MKAEIITIGDEILIGQVVDTNSAWMAQELNEIGVRVHQITSISDDKAHIVSAINQARERVDIVLMTGGLGPTRDDITKYTLAEYFDSELAQDETALKMVTDLFKHHNRPLLEVNIKQAELPVKATPIYNNNGTAPGMMFIENNQLIVSMPGVPYEMKAMMQEAVLPKIKEMYELPYLVHKTILTAGIGESFLADKIVTVEDALPNHIKLAYLPNLNTVRLRFSALGTNKPKLEEELEAITKQVRKFAGEYIAMEGDMKMEEVIGQLLKQKGKTLSTAESCTGGYIAHLITSVSGSSAYYKGTVVSYSNEVKMSELAVKKETLDTVGAVSEETVLQMAAGVKNKLNTDYSIATSGVAGPDGGTEAKPIGTVWIAVSGPTDTFAKKYNFKGNRELIIERSARMGLMMLHKLLLKN